MFMNFSSLNNICVWFQSKVLPVPNSSCKLYPKFHIVDELKNPETYPSLNVIGEKYYCLIPDRKLHMNDQPRYLTSIVFAVFGTNVKTKDLEAKRINSNSVAPK